MDVKDILGVRGGAAAEKAEKPKAQKMERPKGMSREAFKLLDDSHPINPSQLLVVKDQLKTNQKKKPARNRVEWKWTPYKNSGRTDKFQMQRWQRIVKDPTGKVVTNLNEDYWFARYNKKTTILKYNDEEYRNCIQPDCKDGNWSREETDYLFSLCEQFDLRFTVIHDRYNFTKGPSRSIEDLKARYYAVSRRLLVARDGAPELAGHDVIMKQPYDWAAETERKRAIDLLFRLAPDASAEQEKILAAAKRIELRRAQEAQAIKKESEAGGDTGKQPEGPPQLPFPTNGPTFFDHELRQYKPLPGAYSRATLLREELRRQRENFVGAANKPSSNTAKYLKAVEGQMDQTGVSHLGTKMATARTSLMNLALQRELLELIELRRKQAERKQAAAPSASQPQGYIPIPTPMGSQLDLQVLQAPGTAAAVAAAVAAPDASRGGGAKKGAKPSESGGEALTGGGKGGKEASTPRGAAGRKK